MAAVYEGFGELAESIKRGQALTTWRQMAQRSGISSAHLSQLVNGRKPLTADVAGRLTDAFPGFSGEIERLCSRHADGADGVLRIAAQIERLRASGRSREALNAAEAYLAGPAHAYASAELSLTRVELLAELNQFDDASAALTVWIAEAAQSVLGTHAVRIDALVLRLSHSERDEDAREVAVRWLDRCFTDGLVWRRYGCVLWYAGDLVGAFAALTTSLHLGHNRRRVLHARGQVLAELGRANEAIEDLDAAIALKLSRPAEAYARAARGRALFQTGRVAEGEADFQSSLSVTPENAWLHFHIGHALDDQGRHEDALRAFTRSLSMDAPALNRPKREYATIRLNNG